MSSRAAGGHHGNRLLQIEIEVAERTGRHEAVGLGVHGVTEVAAGLGERRLLVHRDDRKAAALAHAGVLDDRAPERVDDLLEVVIARMLSVDPDALARPHDVTPVERSHAQVGQRPLHTRAQGVEADLLHQQPQEVLVRESASRR